MVEFYAAMVDRLDRKIGRLVENLRKSNEEVLMLLDVSATVVPVMFKCGNASMNNVTAKPELTAVLIDPATSGRLSRRVRCDSRRQPSGAANRPTPDAASQRCSLPKRRPAGRTIADRCRHS